MPSFASISALLGNQCSTPGAFPQASSKTPLLEGKLGKSRVPCALHTTRYTKKATGRLPRLPLSLSAPDYREAMTTVPTYCVATITITPEIQTCSVGTSFPEKIFVALSHHTSSEELFPTVTKWFPEEKQKEIIEIWREINREENTEAILKILKELPDFKGSKNHALWKETVAAWLIQLQNSALLREETSSMAKRCDDKDIAYTYQAMQKIARAHAVENKKHETASHSLINASSSTSIHPSIELTTSEEAQASALENILRDIRVKYKASFKSDNKRRLSDPTGEENIKLASFLLNGWRMDSSSNALEQPRFKTTHAGNCIDLAAYAQNLAINKGFNAYVHGFSTIDHAFTYIEDLRGPSYRGWVIDPWSNIVARHTEYAQKLIDKMCKWEDDTKQIYDSNEWAWISPTDPDWLNGIAQLYEQGERRYEKNATYKVIFPGRNLI